MKTIYRGEYLGNGEYRVVEYDATLSAIFTFDITEEKLFKKLKKTNIWVDDNIVYCETEHDAVLEMEEIKAEWLDDMDRAYLMDKVETRGLK